MRTFIIGDIHGCCGALEEMLDLQQPDAQEDQLILLGDLFDRGCESWEVFQVVQELAEVFGERFVLLLGNHEDYLLRDKLTMSEKMIWQRVGRKDTVRSFKAHGAKMESSIPWLKAHCVPWWRGEVDETGRVLQCAHAAVMVEPIELNDCHTLIHDHDETLRNAYAGPLTVTGHIALQDPVWFAGDERNTKRLTAGAWQELPAQGILCIDTGCGKGGKLTGMMVEDGHFRLESVPEA